MPLARRFGRAGLVCEKAPLRNTCAESSIRQSTGADFTARPAASASMMAGATTRAAT